MNEAIIKLLHEDGNALFPAARSLAAKKPLLFSVPIPLARNCLMTPPCRHCSWRPFGNLNPHFTEATMTKQDAVAMARNIERAGMQRAYFPSGWIGYEVPEDFYDCIEAVRQNTKLELFGESGTVNRKTLINLKKAGLDGYICGIETSNEILFRKMRPGEDYRRRMQTILDAKDIGLKVLTTFILGIGESIDDIAETINRVKDLNVDSVHVLPLMPSPFTEMEKYSTPNHYWSATVTAVTRIMMPEINLYAFSNQLWHEAAWAVRSGANAFWLSYRMPKNNPALFGDDISWLTFLSHNTQLVEQNLKTKNSKA